MKRLVMLLMLLWAVSAGAAEVKDEDPSEAQVRAIAKDLRCAVCQNQSVYESNSDLAKDMLKVIRDKVQAGQGETEIRQYFHDRYGDYIYLEPTRSGANLLLWVIPFIGLLLGAWALWVAMRRWRNAPPPVSPTTAPKAAVNAALEQRIKKEMDGVEL